MKWNELTLVPSFLAQNAVVKMVRSTIGVSEITSHYNVPTVRMGVDLLYPPPPTRINPVPHKTGIFVS